MTDTDRPESRTYTTHVVVWRRGPLDKPERIRETANYFPTIERAVAFEVGVITGDRLVTTAPIERTLTVGQDVEVQAFGRTRAGLVTGFTRTKVVVDFVRNGNGDIEVGRRFVPEAVYETDEAATIARVKAEVETELAILRPSTRPAPPVEPELAAGLGTLTGQLRESAAARDAQAGRAVTPTATCKTDHTHVSAYAAELCDRLVDELAAAKTVRPSTTRG